MSYQNGWNEALNRAILEIKRMLKVDSNINKYIQKLKELKIYEN